LNQLPWHSDCLCFSLLRKKGLEVDGLFQVFHDLMKEDFYVSPDHPLESFF